jgi:hypothetical protein
MCPLGDHTLLIFGGSHSDRELPASPFPDIHEAQLYIRASPDPASTGFIPGFPYAPGIPYDASGHVVSEPWPEKRNAMSLTRVGKRALMFGGDVYGHCYFNDLWAFQEAGEGELPSPPSPPPSLAQAVLMDSTRFADVVFRLPAETGGRSGAKDERPGRQDSTTAEWQNGRRTKGQAATKTVRQVTRTWRRTAEVG